ncbi:MAG: hypothetical protein AAF270_00730 [Pseudomonadota bacterium]
MPEAPAKTVILQDTLVAKLDERIQQTSNPEERARLLERFQRHANDYRTLGLMRELPVFAEPALHAFQQLSADDTATLDQQALMSVLSAAYQTVCSKY